MREKKYGLPEQSKRKVNYRHLGMLIAAAVAADLAQTNGDLEPLAQALAQSSRGKQTTPVGRRRTPRNAN